ncbi:hypothetical protein D920_00952 [Enterococcus faecalis 13-SD-W-01]|nr:hypothetical protein D920_00952 [Enterococcus faecalis 13-SD-W-01]
MIMNYVPLSFLKNIFKFSATIVYHKSKKMVESLFVFSVSRDIMFLHFQGDSGKVYLCVNTVLLLG